MSHPNTTIAQHMRQVLLGTGRSTITRFDALLLDSCARRCTHTTLMSVPQRERHRRIFNALEVSALFLKKTWRGPSGWRVEYRLLEAESQALSACLPTRQADRQAITPEIIERARLAGAMANVKDAERDLVRWPDLSRQIVADLLQAIEAREAEEIA